MVTGVGSPGSLPIGHFVDCTFDQFDPSSKTTRGILVTVGLSGRQRVLLSILKKVHMQAGAGRKNSALIRGLSEELKAMVPEVLELLASSNFVVKGHAGSNVLYYPVRGASARVKRMLDGGSRAMTLCLPAPDSTCLSALRLYHLAGPDGPDAGDDSMFDRHVRGYIDAARLTNAA